MLKANIIIASVLVTLLGCAEKQPAQNSLTVNVIPPEHYSPNDVINVVGSFNRWALEGGDARTLMLKDGVLTAEIPVTDKNLFFTFIQNKDWQRMPANEMGKSECPHLYQSTGKPEEVNVRIPLWTGDKPLKDADHTLAGNVKQHNDFEMPQLQRVGNISVYLPPSYELSPTKSYPVIYMLDGQNIFDAKTAHSDEWRIDELLEQGVASGALTEMIVVAVPNGEQRWSEYNAWDFRNMDGKEVKGTGSLTIQFIKDTLKPFIDNTYRSQTSAQATGLAGSSLGGLMALYAALDYSDTFGFVAAFSPSLAVENMAGAGVIFEAIKQKKTIGTSKIYIDMGLMEFGNYEKIEELNSLLLRQGVKPDNLKLVKDDLGRHCEVDWSRRFPEAIQWLTSAQQ